MTLTVEDKVYEAGRVFCVGMNYVAHIQEMKNQVPTTPVIFMKPATSLVQSGTTIPRPVHGRDLHYETEVVVMIGRDGRPATDGEARSAIAGLSLGLDLTLRDVQNELRKQGLPWEFSKAFDGSAPIGRFVPLTGAMDLGNLSFTGEVNGRVRQNGNTGNMVFPITALIRELAKVWLLRAGDLIYTGTPEGVGALNAGDHITVSAPWAGSFSWTLA
jgi:2-keto-4-pentenoate hydratase/2-oxohepta-3-ene-1,7-dioic acid hydratase in catechol pathway